MSVTAAIQRRFPMERGLPRYTESRRNIRLEAFAGGEDLLRSVQQSAVEMNLSVNGGGKGSPLHAAVGRSGDGIPMMTVIGDGEAAGNERKYLFPGEDPAHAMIWILYQHALSRGVADKENAGYSVVLSECRTISVKQQKMASAILKSVQKNLIGLSTETEISSAKNKARKTINDILFDMAEQYIRFAPFPGNGAVLPDGWGLISRRMGLCVKKSSSTLADLLARLGAADPVKELEEYCGMIIEEEKARNAAAEYAGAFMRCAESIPCKSADDIFDSVCGEWKTQLEESILDETEKLRLMLREKKIVFGKLTAKKYQELFAPVANIWNELTSLMVYHALLGFLSDSLRSVLSQKTRSAEESLRQWEAELKNFCLISESVDGSADTSPAVKWTDLNEKALETYFQDPRIWGKELLDLAPGRLMPGYHDRYILCNDAVASGLQGVAGGSLPDAEKKKIVPVPGLDSALAVVCAVEKYVNEENYRAIHPAQAQGFDSQQVDHTDRIPDNPAYQQPSARDEEKTAPDDLKPDIRFIEEKNTVVCRNLDDLHEKGAEKLRIRIEGLDPYSGRPYEDGCFDNSNRSGGWKLPLLPAGTTVLYFDMILKNGSEIPDISRFVIKTEPGRTLPPQYSFQNEERPGGWRLIKLDPQKTNCAERLRGKIWIKNNGRLCSLPDAGEQIEQGYFFPVGSGSGLTVHFRPDGIDPEPNAV